MFHEKSSRYKSSSLLIQQETFNEAFKLLSTAVGYDEKKRINEAMDFYKRALKALNVALDITYTEEEWYDLENFVYMLGKLQKLCMKRC